MTDERTAFEAALVAKYGNHAGFHWDDGLKDYLGQTSIAWAMWQARAAQPAVGRPMFRGRPTFTHTPVSIMDTNFDVLTFQVLTLAHAQAVAEMHYQLGVAAFHSSTGSPIQAKAAVGNADKARRLAEATLDKANAVYVAASERRTIAEQG